ncbi:hypothetical protein M378DRAFT_163247, partial [Amanita muscaria Koide BX008]
MKTQMRYYTIFLVAANALQIHLFTHKGITSDRVCLVVDLVRESLGRSAYGWLKSLNVLYNCSCKIAIFNAVLLVLPVPAFIGIGIDLGIDGKKLIAEVLHLPSQAIQ